MEIRSWRHSSSRAIRLYLTSTTDPRCIGRQCTRIQSTTTVASYTFDYLLFLCTSFSLKFSMTDLKSLVSFQWWWRSTNNWNQTYWHAKSSKKTSLSSLRYHIANCRSSPAIWRGSGQSWQECSDTSDWLQLRLTSLADIFVLYCLCKKSEQPWEDKECRKVRTEQLPLGVCHYLTKSVCHFYKKQTAS